MINKTIIYIFSIVSFFGLAASEADQQANFSTIAKVQLIKEVNVTEVKLKNGMTIWLKPTNFESDEIVLKLAALGGYAVLDPEDRFSGELAASIAWESGIGGFSADQLSQRLFDHSLEFSPKIKALSRTIEGASGKDGLELFLDCVKMVFTNQNFTEEGWNAARSLERDTLSIMAQDYDDEYEAEFLEINTQSMSALRPMRVKDIDKVKFDEAKRFFRRCFSDPSDFICTIVGSFDVQQTINLVSKYLGAIPKADTSSNFYQLISAPFPKGITRKEIYLPQRSDSLTRITFPIQIELDENTFHTMAFACEVAEAHLRRVITQQLDLSYGVDVSYEFPLYPYLKNPWISIRYRCDNKIVELLKLMILKEMHSLQDLGVKEKDIQEIKKLEEGSDEYWLHDNFYWMSMLTNYYLWKWTPQSIYGVTSTKDITAKTVNEFLKTSVSLDNYSVLIAKP